MLLRSSTHHTAKMTAIIRALSLLIFLSQLLDASPIGPATADINAPAVNSDDPSRQFPPENEPNPSSENETQNNISPDSSNEDNNIMFPPGISLSNCLGGSFHFSVKTPDSSLNITPLFQYSNNSNESSNALHGGGMVFSCHAKPNDEKEGEMKVSCRCRKARQSVFDTIFLWMFGFFIIYCISDNIRGPRGTDESAKDKNVRDGRNIVRQPRVSQTGSEMEMKGNDTVETVVDDEISEDFDDSNYPMG